MHKKKKNSTRVKKKVAFANPLVQADNHVRRRAQKSRPRLGAMAMGMATADDDMNDGPMAKKRDDVYPIEITVIVDTNEAEILVVDAGDVINEAIAAGLDNVDVDAIDLVELGDDVLLDDDTFEYAGVEDGARLHVTLKRVTFETVVEDILELNPHLNKEVLMFNVNVDLNDALQVNGDLLWNNLNIHSLPESFGDLTVRGIVYLYHNQLTTLPKRFGSLIVKRSLFLSQNHLTSLPESFGSLTVGGDLYLNRNRLTRLPESFGSLTTGGDLDLRDNDLTTLPGSFGSLTVGGELFLHRNRLTSLPERALSQLRIRRI